MTNGNKNYQPCEIKKDYLTIGYQTFKNICDQGTDD